MMKKKNKSEEKSSVAREEMSCYQRRTDRDGVTHVMTQKTLDEECMTLAESKKKILEKIHTHFQNL